jgi:phosphate transport system substrate-binding protein
MNKLSRFLYILAILSLLAFPLSACKAKAGQSKTGQLSGTITVSGAFALYPMMQRWAEEFKKINPNVNFDISAGGAGKGMTDTLSGAVDIGMVSREVTTDEISKGAYPVPVNKDAVFPTVNSKNPVLNDLLAKGVTEDIFYGIYISGTIKTWGEVVGKPEITDEIHVYTRSDSAGAADAWAKFLGGKKQENLLGIGVSGDPGLLDAVVKDSLGIGYNNLNYAFDPTTGNPVAGTTIVPIDNNKNGKADDEETVETKAKAIEMVGNGKFPSPPARALYLVTKGKPTGLTLAFIQWVLADGQQYLNEVGYVALPSDVIAEAIKKLR